MRPEDAAPLGTIRSLAYFLPVIEEVLGMRVSPDYFQYRLVEFVVNKARNIGAAASSGYGVSAAR